MEDLRLERARRQLESTSRSLDEIAAACGLGSAEVLRRLFVRRLGVTPGRYRASFGRDAAPRTGRRAAGVEPARR